MNTWKIIQTLISAVNSLLVFLFLYKQLGISKKKIPPALLLLLPISYVPVLFDFKSQGNIIYYVIWVIYSFLFCDGKPYMRLIFGAIPSALLFSAEKIAHSLVFFITPANVMGTVSLSAVSYVQQLLHVFISLILFIPVSSLHSRDNRHIPVLQRFLFLLMMTAGVVALAVLSITMVTVGSRYSQNIESLAVKLCMTVSGVVLFMYIGVMILFYNTSHMYMKNSQMQMAAQKAELENEHNAHIKETYDAIRVWKHDTVNHLRTIRSMAKKGETAEIVSYIDQAQEKIESVISFVNTGHPAVDAVISNKLFAAQQSGVCVESLICIPEDLHISSVDICTVLSNLLDNAREAAQNAKEHYLHFGMSMKGRMLCIQVENSASGDYKTKDNDFISTKPLPQAHGLGLKSVEKIVKENSGIMKITPENDKFTVLVMLPPNREEE